jgi:hypothetical protein
MSKADLRWKQYYETGQYRGFKKIREQKYRLSGQTHITFSDGKREIFAAGIFKEAALLKIFDQIDQELLTNH